MARASTEFCDVVRAELQRGSAGVAPTLASYRDLLFQRQYQLGGRDTRDLELQSYADSVQQQTWKLQARYGAATPRNFDWWRFPLCQSGNPAAPYFSRRTLVAAGYQPRPLLQLPRPESDGNGGRLWSLVDTVVPTSALKYVPVIADRVLDPKLSVLFFVLFVITVLVVMLGVAARTAAKKPKPVGA